MEMMAPLYLTTGPCGFTLVRFLAVICILILAQGSHLAMAASIIQPRKDDAWHNLTEVCRDLDIDRNILYADCTGSPGDGYRYKNWLDLNKCLTWNHDTIFIEEKEK